MRIGTMVHAFVNRREKLKLLRASKLLSNARTDVRDTLSLTRHILYDDEYNRIWHTVMELDDIIRTITTYIEQEDDE